MPRFFFLEEEAQLDLFDEFFSTDRNKIVEDYCAELTKNGAMVIFDTNHLSRLLGFNEQLLHAVSASPQNFYRTYKINKKSGGTRSISEPMPTLKSIQRYIIDNIISGIAPHKTARAFRKKYTLKGAANIHKDRPYMLSLDIKDFFPSITGYRVYTLFFELGYTSQISRLLSGLCTLDNGLPQGAPSSPMLSNLYLRDFDERVFGRCKELGIFYTRYADDMTFSSQLNNVTGLIGFVRSELATLGLKLNNKKTSYSGRGARKYVNGIVVNKKLNILKTERRFLRKEMYYIRKYGINGHIRNENITSQNYIDHLIGRINYAYFITNDEKLKKDIDYLREIKKVM